MKGTDKLIVGLICIVIILGSVLLFKIFMDNGNKKINSDENIGIASREYRSTENNDGSKKNVAERLEEVEYNNPSIKAFNNAFTVYEGKNRTETDIMLLKDAVANKNKSKSEHKINLIIDETKKTKFFTVKLYYDSEGYVNKIEVK